MGTNWFMPALVNSRFGLSGMSEDEGTMVCDFDLKKSRKSFRTWVLERIGVLVILKNCWLPLATVENQAGEDSRNGGFKASASFWRATPPPAPEDLGCRRKAGRQNFQTT